MVKMAKKLKLLVVIGLMMGCTQQQRQNFHDQMELNACISEISRYGSDANYYQYKDKCKRTIAAQKIVDKDPVLKQYYEQKAEDRRRKMRALLEEIKQ